MLLLSARSYELAWRDQRSGMRLMKHPCCWVHSHLGRLLVSDRIRCLGITSPQDFFLSGNLRFDEKPEELLRP
jgi:hypothetical protein